MTRTWPLDWDQLVKGVGCSMCASERLDRDQYGVRIHTGRYSDSYLQRADVQRGYTLVIWRGRHVSEPTELTEAEANGYWADVLDVARGLIAHYQPLKLNYETLGNSLPHLHTHLVPRYVADPAPGAPFPLLPVDDTFPILPEDQVEAEARALQSLITQR
ncbi:HIT family protein [Embleya sp. NPDC056575]|uniref:HIT family protein n=1 Tax=unclassified Embleya TaxID=2699296 RepID=UPI0036C2319E